MITRETKDINEIHKVLKNPVVYDAASDDNSPCSVVFMAPVTNDYRYIIGVVDGEIIGLLVYHSYKDGEKCHVQVLPEHRKAYAKEFGEMSLSHRDTKKPLYAEIPDNYQNVLSYAKGQGFKVVIKEDRGYTKNGIKYPTNELIYTGV